MSTTAVRSAGVWRVVRVEASRALTHLTLRRAAPVALALVATLSALYAFFSREIAVPAGASSALANPAVLANVYLTGFTIGFVLAALLGAWVAVGGRGEGELLVGLLICPNRGRLAVAKAIVSWASGLMLGTVLLGTSVTIGAAFAHAAGAPLALNRPEVYESLLYAWLAIPLWAVLGCGVALLLRGLTQAAVVLLVWIFVIDVVLVGGLTAVKLGAVAAVLPTNLTASISGTAVADGVDLLSQGAAVGVLALYAVGLWAVGTARLRWLDDAA